MEIRNLMKPSRLLLSVFILQFSFYFLYTVGIIKSYRISFVTSNLFGLTCFFIYYLFQYVLLCISDSGKSFVSGQQLKCLNMRRVIILSCICMVIAFCGFLRLTANLIQTYSVSVLFFQILRNRQLDVLVYGSGNTLLCNFTIISLMLLSLIINKRDKKLCMLWFINFVFLVVYAGFLASRILILQGLFFSLIIIVRRFAYTKKIGSKLIMIGLVVGCFLVVTSGFRDYDQMGYRYTDSKIEWGISRCADYLISTFNTSAEIDNYTTGKNSSFPTNTMEIVSKLTKQESSGNSNLSWRQDVSAAEYTNIGAFAQIYSDWGLFFLIPVLLISTIYVCFWRYYDQGKLSGYMIWPLMLYNIIETWRIYYLGTAMAEVLFVLCCIACIICRKCFVVE